MNKLGQRIFVLVALLSCVAIAAAQGGGGGGQGRGGRGGQRGGRGGFVTELSLAMRSDVQKELAITDDEKTKLTDLSQKSRPQRNTGGGAGAGAGAGQTDQADRQKQFDEMRAQQHKDLAAILNDSQMKRLGELLLQRQGAQALGQASVQSSLGLSSDQVSKIKDLIQKNRDASTALRQRRQDGTMTPEEIRAATQKNTETTNAELLKVLTPEQANKFKDMQGKAFTFDTTNGRGGGGGL